jgi:hypothetical protein
LLPGRYTPVDIKTGTLSLGAPYTPTVPTLGLVEEDSIVCRLVEAVYFRVATVKLDLQQAVRGEKAQPEKAGFVICLWPEKCQE